MLKTIRISFKIINVLFIAMAMSVPVAAANPIASCYVEVVRAYNRMLVGKVLTSEEGNQIRFGEAGVTTDGRFIVAYEAVFANGRTSAGVESLRIDQSGVYLDQITEGVTARRYFASVEEPYDVLRIKPVSPQTTDFIARDCVRSKNGDGTVCYVKVRYMNDVIVSEYRESTKWLPNR